MKVTNFLLMIISVILAVIAVSLNFILYDLENLIEVVPILAALVA